MAVLIEKYAQFVDNKGQKQQVKILINDGIFIGIDTYDDNNNHTGYMRIFFHPNNRLYLDSIYCYDEFRGSGIANYISDLADFILNEYIGYTIRGVYEPTQLSTDRENNIERNIEDLDNRAKAFYKKAGYEIIGYEDYINNRSKYPNINEDDFYLGEGGPATIVAKTLKEKNHQFVIENDAIHHVNYESKKIK